MAHRFFVPPEAVAGDVVTFDAGQARQLRSVLRLRVGAQVIVLDNSGFEYETTLTELGRDAAAGRIDTRQPSVTEPRASLALYQSPIKGERFEWVLQKGTELGVCAFVPLLCQRTVLRDPGRIEKKRLRWERIIREAAEQSGRGRLPRLADPLSFADACRDAAACDLALIPWEGRRDAPSTESADGTNAVVVVASPCRDVLRARDDPPQSIALLIGPEGGFEEEEIALAREYGIRPVTLGPRILRAETAALAAATIVLSELGEMA